MFLRPLFLLLLALLCTPFLFGQHANRPGTNIRFVTDAQRLPDETVQRELRHTAAWQQFVAAHGTWYVEFNEATGLPHRAYGKPITTAGANAAQRAMNFLSGQLSGLALPLEELELQAVAPATKHTYVHFKQRHQGLDVVFSHVMVKLDQQHRVIAFGLELLKDATVDLSPTLAPAQAGDIAGSGLSSILSVEVENDLSILPIPDGRRVDARLVYRVMVHTQDGARPGHHLCLVDAHTGRIWYRQDRVVEENPPPAGAEAEITGTVYEQHPFIPAVVGPMANLKVTVGATSLFADGAGYYDSGITGPVSATFELEGRWSRVRTGGVTPTFTTTLNDGANAVSFDPHANIRERSAYFHVNVIHDHHKVFLPSFTGMDIVLPTNVDVSGSCNAFYDGASINFYAQGGDCQSYAQVGDVVYHEYGHGINDKFYQNLGSAFTNGAMNEGYADVWAISINEDPLMAEGSSLSNPDNTIRRYDQDPKIYPIHLVGQVHADGEIIAGAWWDTHLLLGGNMTNTMTLFAEAYPGLQANTFDGNEGVAYRDVLLDVLQADDNDGDITNGTPNGNAIVQGFAIHGITLISNAELIHTPIASTPAAAGITINATLNLTLPFMVYVDAVVLKYRVNNGATWDQVAMTNTTGNIYQGVIPAQPAGTVVAYYLGVMDLYGNINGVVPSGAALPDPNIPYFILVGMALDRMEDCDNVNNLGNWQTGIPGDNATTGIWSLEIPVASFSSDGSIVQTGAPFTPGGELCFITGNANSGDGPGVNDVDGGHTTLLGGPIDMSSLVNPTIVYHRWYTNNPPTGANPNADWWQVSISNNGSSWVPVENTKTSDRSWRRFAFRVEDHVTPNNTVWIKFVASDSIRPGQNLNGGSLVEAAIDDIELYANAGNIGMMEHADWAATLQPVPTSALLELVALPPGSGPVTLRISDATGRTLQERVVAMGGGMLREQLDVSALPPGTYMLHVMQGGARLDRRFVVMR
ncbi:MAG: hypothetical protein JNM31_07170 [Flavobacteriales bacterium]|nr:hypothetical protein [Flavobacteriales bacterium]